MGKQEEEKGGTNVQRQQLLWGWKLFGEADLLESDNPCLKHQPKKSYLILSCESREGLNCTYLALHISLLTSFWYWLKYQLTNQLFSDNPTPQSILAFLIPFIMFMFFSIALIIIQHTIYYLYLLYNVGSIIAGIFPLLLYVQHTKQCLAPNRGSTCVE